MAGFLEQGFALSGCGRIFGDGRNSYRSKLYADTSFQIETLASDTARIDVGLGYAAPNQGYTVHAFLKNLTDMVGIANATVNTANNANGILGVNLILPRTYGIQTLAQF